MVNENVCEDCGRHMAYHDFDCRTAVPKDEYEQLQNKFNSAMQAVKVLIKAVQKYADPKTHSMDDTGFIWSGDYFDYDTAKEALVEANKIIDNLN